MSGSRDSLENMGAFFGYDNTVALNVSNKNAFQSHQSHNLNNAITDPIDTHTHKNRTMKPIEIQTFGKSLTKCRASRALCKIKIMCFCYELICMFFFFIFILNFHLFGIIASTDS